MHPLTNDLSKLSEEELHSKRSDLNTRLSFAYRMGHGDMVNQLQLILGDYAMEVERRNQKMLEQAQKSGRLGSIDDTAKDITKD
jgi:hypothetical protein